MPQRLVYMLRALGQRNYRLFFGGQVISLTGTWMTMTATSWLVYRLTGSSLMLGLVGFAGQGAAFLMSPVAGTFVDRLDRRRLLVATQTLSMLQSFALAALTLSGHVTIELVIVLLAFQGVVNAFDMSGRQAFVVELVSKADLPNAIALNSSIFNAAQFVGPMVAGVIVAAAGEGQVFLADGFTYLAVLLALLAMRLAARPAPTPSGAGIAVQVREGLAYVHRSVPIRSIMGLLFCTSLVGLPYKVLMPVYAKDVLGGGSATYGLLVGATGCGAMAGALWLAGRKTVLGLGRMISLAAALFGSALVALAFTRTLWLSLPLLVVTGFGFIVQMASSNTVIQTIVEDSKRGRVMSFYVMAILGAMPIGSLLGGAAAERIGAPNTLICGGAGCLLAALWFRSKLPRVREAVRPIYERLGILPEVSSGLQMASRMLPPEE
jgi:MFS family permease